MVPFLVAVGDFADHFADGGTITAIDGTLECKAKLVIGHLALDAIFLRSLRLSRNLKVKGIHLARHYASPVEYFGSKLKLTTSPDDGSTATPGAVVIWNVNDGVAAARSIAVRMYWQAPESAKLA